MEINFKDEVHMNNIQFGDNNKMYIYKESNLFTKENWEELDFLLSEKLKDRTLDKSQISLINTALGFIEERNEMGFRKFFIKNKDSLITNILSNMMSSGLSLLLSNLCT